MSGILTEIYSRRRRTKRKRASEIFREVDPKLNVIDGGVRHKANREDWDKTGGLFCPKCGEEVVRLIGGRCPRCNSEIEVEFAEKLADRTARRYYQRRLNEGTISLRQMKENRGSS